MSNQIRAGNTLITSVSVSKEFSALMNQYKLSPTDVFRKGIGVSLCDIGVEKYQTPMNFKRLEYVKEFFKDENMLDFFEKLLKFAEEIDSHSKDSREEVLN